MSKERKEIIKQINEKWASVTEIEPELKELFKPQFIPSINHVFLRQSLFNIKIDAIKCPTTTFLEIDTAKLAQILIFVIGAYYEEGEGVSVDYTKALYWYTKSAELGFYNSQIRIAEIYATGTGVSLNYEEALNWYKKACEGGAVSPQLDLARLYRIKIQDFEKAVFWYESFLKQGMEKLLKAKEYNQWLAESVDKAVDELANCYKDGMKDNKKIFDMYKRVAEMGNAKAAFILGASYFYGTGVEKDYEIAVFWLTRAAEQNHGDAQYYLKKCYENGLGVEKDIEKAVYWCKKAAEHNQPEAQFCMGIWYEEGTMVEKNLIEAFNWYSRSAYSVSSSAHNLGRCYYNGIGVEKNNRKAFEWFSIAAEAGCVDSMNVLVQCYEEGLSVKKNLEKAKYWRIKAAEQRLENAKAEKLNRIKL